MLTLALAVLLTLSDPGGDLGDGTVRLPTAAVGRPNGALDVTQLELYNSEALTFSLSFGSLANPFELKYGFTFPIIEIYIDDQSGTGNTTLLPGSGMRLPGGATWKYAFKLTGDSLQIFEASADGWQEVTAKFPSRVTVQGTTLLVSSSLPRPEKLDMYGMVGSYTGFNETGWMPLSRNESPWAYSSASQNHPVLDIIAPTFEAQRNALASGVLPVIQPPRRTNPWLYVMIGGILIAATGVLLRFAPRTTPVKTIPQYVPAPSPNQPIDPNTETTQSTATTNLSNQSKVSTARPGPYQAEPLKSKRSTVLKNAVASTTDLQPSSAETELTPGQFMAAERTKAIIVGDRVAREAPSKPAFVPNDVTTNNESVQVPGVENETPLETASAELTPELNQASTTNPETNAATKTAPSETPIVSSTAIPLFQPSSSRLAPVRPSTVPEQKPPAFNPASLESWEEDEFAFLWEEEQADGEKLEIKPKPDTEV